MDGNAEAEASREEVEIGIPARTTEDEIELEVFQSLLHGAAITDA